MGVGINDEFTSDNKPTLAFTLRTFFSEIKTRPQMYEDFISFQIVPNNFHKLQYYIKGLIDLI